ncbi:unnamed protein product, partial [Mesorhabditis spiculigera]
MSPSRGIAPYKSGALVVFGEKSPGLANEVVVSRLNPNAWRASHGIDSRNYRRRPQCAFQLLVISFQQSTNVPSASGASFITQPSAAGGSVAHAAPTFNAAAGSPVEQEIAAFATRRPEVVRPEFATGPPLTLEESDIRRTQVLDAAVEAQRQRAEDARRLREEQFKVEQMHEKERQEQIREEMKKRRDEMIHQLEELKEAERRQKELLAEKERLAEEARALIAQRNEALASANHDGITDVNTAVRYKLKPSQCAAINKFTRVFKITDPSDWIQRNCQFAKRYFPQASCTQIQNLIESCFVFLMML